MPEDKYKAIKTRYSIAHLLVFTTLSAISAALLVQGFRRQSALDGFALLASIPVMIGTLLYAGAMLSSKRRAIWRIALAIALIAVIYSASLPALFPLVR